MDGGAAETAAVLPRGTMSSPQEGPESIQEKQMESHLKYLRLKEYLGQENYHYKKWHHGKKYITQVQFGIYNGIIVSVKHC